MTYRKPTDWVKKRRGQLLCLVQLLRDLCPTKREARFYNYANKKLKENAIYISAFITEDHTPLRAN